MVALLLYAGGTLDPQAFDNLLHRNDLNKSFTVEFGDRERVVCKEPTR